MDVALFGGSFDPPHVGHVLAVAYAVATGGFDRVLVVPVFAHAFEKALSPFDHRVQMARLAMSDLRSAEVTTVERDLGAPSRTLRTVTHLAREHPDWRLRILVGADVLADRDKWLGFDELTQIAPLFLLGRAGVESPGAPPALLPAVSSTEVRRLLRTTPGDRSASPELGRLVPRAVLRYLDQHGLHR
jgi:nicotinate-nucleotide adenylyltransferase